MATAKQKALAKQQAVEEERELKRQQEEEAREAKEWSIGTKDGSRSKALEEKEIEKQRKAAEKASLLAADEEQSSTVKKIAKTKKKGKDDFDLLNQALKAAPLTKAQKEAEAKKKAAEDQKKKEEEARLAKEVRLKAERDSVAAAAAKGMVMNHTDDLMRPIMNRMIDEDEIGGTGLDAAVDAISGAFGKGAKIGGVDKKAKELFEAFSEETLRELKEDQPGLKLSQYKERINDLWKMSPKNPKNAARRQVFRGRDAWKNEMVDDDDEEGQDS